VTAEDLESKLSALDRRYNSKNSGLFEPKDKANLKL